MLGPTREKHDVLNVLKTKNQEDFPFTQQKNQGYHKNVNFFVSKKQAVLKSNNMQQNRKLQAT